MEKFKWGVIGPGRIAEQFARDLKVTSGELYAIASRSGAADFASKFDVPVVYDSYQALAEDPAVDAIYIATPHPFHYENARLCLEAGKPVLCEKPLTVNAKQIQALIDLSRTRGVFLMEALWTRYLPAYQTIRTWLESGVIGEVIAMRGNFCFKGKPNEQDRWLNPDLAGGTLLDLGIYPIAVSQWIMQENPVNVQSLATLGPTGVDITLSVNMKYAGGAVCQFLTSFELQMKNKFSIYGSQGAIHIHNMFHAATAATLEVGEKETTVNEPLRSAGFEYEIEEAMRCIREGALESPRMSHADSLANVQLMDRIREQIGVKYPFE